ncbi:MAG: hypothetical protein HUJ77_14070 [Clostridium sp.]|uniref:hypothetical protein n=1 Tax=Clostridium sp. TaxID=1506 RepID=UPI0025C6717F|nr:hypothetical protein [Clostridium sp.]MCF0149506.1 hypothetical protein [Clostridium sp.]
MNPQQIIEQMEMTRQALQKGNTNLKTLSIVKAEAERNYRVEVRKEILKLRLEKVPTTIINDLVRGNEKVAELRLKRDIAESDYYTCISAIENLRLDIEVLRSKLTWLRVELKNS